MTIPNISYGGTAANLRGLWILKLRNAQSTVLAPLRRTPWEQCLPAQKSSFTSGRKIMSRLSINSSSMPGISSARCRSALFKYKDISTRYHPRNASSIPQHSTLTFSRSVSSLPTPQGPSKVQHIKFTAPKKKWFGGQWFRRTVYLILCMQAIEWVARYRRNSNNGPDVKQAIETVKSITQEEKAAANSEPISEEVENDMVIEIDSDDAWFLPFGWPKKKDLISYKSTDEEWIEFRKLSNDRKKKAEIRDQAASFIEQVAKQSPMVSKLFGEPIRCTKHWLDIDYPTRYSDGYELTGFLMTDDILAWASRDYEEQTIQQFFRVISPIALMNAFWDVTKTVFGGKEGLVTKTKENEKFPIAIPGVPDLSATPVLGQIVKKHSMQLRRPKPSGTVPRGCVIVSGRVDLTGNRYWGTFHFFGCYDPKKDAWSETPHISLRMVRPLMLAPKG